MHLKFFDNSAAVCTLLGEPFDPEEVASEGASTTYSDVDCLDCRREFRSVLWLLYQAQVSYPLTEGAGVHRLHSSFGALRVQEGETTAHLCMRMRDEIAAEVRVSDPRTVTIIGFTLLPMDPIDIPNR